MKRIADNPYVFPERVGDISFVKGSSKTKQSFTNECDINKIMAKANKTGMLVDVGAINSRMAVFADVSSIGDYREVVTKIAAANAAFENLPGEVKQRFGNDPAALLLFLQDENNLAEAVTLGLVDKKVLQDKVAADEAAKAAAAAAATKPAV